jgi:hypothetical protein
MELKVGLDIEFTFSSGKKQAFKITRKMIGVDGWECHGLNLSGHKQRCYVKFYGGSQPLGVANGGSERHEVVADSPLLSKTKKYGTKRNKRTKG